MKQITVNGHTYKSISEAWRELESPVPEVTVRWRLKNGWHPEDAFLATAIPPHLRRANLADLMHHLERAGAIAREI